MASLAHLGHADLLDTDQAAKYAGVAPVTIRQWKSRGLLAPAIPGDGHRTRHLYAKPDIDQARKRPAEQQADDAAS